ncbi:L-lactate dehydrogenase [Gehongia tenuis]|uniref:L-lactate dehydrogenase n=1 Tax=Gehongia tenuis TaxID=2763655 RepID=A0A926D5Z8_9FIRM|nr:L-lactate dehydrogenase [Gehongia tenuis]MBC8532276.1 L-lactate dehydrogenase [Gehongia tenuis]
MKRQGNKVGVIGTGFVGATTAYTLTLSGLVSDLVLVDKDKEKALGEAMDLNHGAAFYPSMNVMAGEYSDLKGSDVVIIAAGANQKPGETRMDLAHKNAAIFREIVPEVVRNAPDAVLLVVTNPVDVLTDVTMEVSGLPFGRVLGSGTVLDTSRLRHLISVHTHIDARNIHTYVLGEHGDSEVVAMSLTRLAGMDVHTFCEKCGRCDMDLGTALADQIESKVKNAAYEIIARKGATYYAVALAVRRIVEAILRDEKAILTVSGPVKGIFGMPNVCLSLPAVVGGEGIERFVPVDLAKDELEALCRSAEAIDKVIKSL